ncbi:MAG: hypothetical protein ACK5NT_09655 [Pyrinomonadaceae bacterium]
MKISRYTVFFYAILVALLISSTGFSKNQKAAEKISIKELVERHLRSIGTPEKLSALKSITAYGGVESESKGATNGTTSGTSVLASEGNKYLIGLQFPNPDYPSERIGFDGTNVTVSFLRPGVRSLLGNFIRDNAKTFKQGLLTGALSTAWEFYRFDEKHSKMKSAGTKNIDGNVCYRVTLNNSSDSDLMVSLYFDAKTFRHLKTEYTKTLNPSMGASVDLSAYQSETRYRFVEIFDDFRDVGGLTLPNSYRIYYEDSNGRRTNTMLWNIKLSEVLYNQEIEDSIFHFDG